jgi:hypothetical protein
MRELIGTYRSLTDDSVFRVTPIKQDKDLCRMEYLETKTGKLPITTPFAQIKHLLSYKTIQKVETYSNDI